MTASPTRRPSWETPQRPTSASAACWWVTTTRSPCRPAACWAVSCVGNQLCCCLTSWQQVLHLHNNSMLSCELWHKGKQVFAQLNTLCNDGEPDFPFMQSMLLSSCLGASDASRSEGHSGDMAAVVVPVLFLLLLGVCGSLGALYLRHRRLQNNFTAFANSHYNSRLGSAIFSSGDELGRTFYFVHGHPGKPSEEISRVQDLSVSDH